MSAPEIAEIRAGLASLRDEVARLRLVVVALALALGLGPDVVKGAWAAVEQAAHAAGGF